MEQATDIASFRAQVYLIVQKVPRGRVSTYGQIAAMIPPPVGVEPPQYERIRARWVGRAMRHAPDGVPWHRIINSRGRISLPAGSRPGSIQRIRLEAEGITFDRRGAVDLKRFQWEGPDARWAEERGLLPASQGLGAEPIQLELISTKEDDQAASRS